MAKLERWGAYAVGDLTVRARDPLGLFARSGRVRAATPVKIYPTRESLRRLLRPAETQLYSGDELARTKSETLPKPSLCSRAICSSLLRLGSRSNTR